MLFQEKLKKVMADHDPPLGAPQAAKKWGIKIGLLYSWLAVRYLADGSIASVLKDRARRAARAAGLPADYFDGCSNVVETHSEAMSRGPYLRERASSKVKRKYVKKADKAALTAARARAPRKVNAILQADSLPWSIEQWMVRQVRVVGPREQEQECVANMRASGFAVTRQGAYVDGSMMRDNTRFLVTGERFEREGDAK
jgi:hypothetical protein